MTSIVEAREHLAGLASSPPLGLRRFECEQLAEHLTALLDALSQAEGVIEPFARVADSYEPTSTRDTRIGDDFDGSEVLYGRTKPDLGDFRRAAAFLASLKEKK